MLANRTLAFKWLFMSFTSFAQTYMYMYLVIRVFLNTRTKNDTVEARITKLFFSGIIDLLFDGLTSEVKKLLIKKKAVLRLSNWLI